MAPRTKAQVCGRSLVGIVGKNSAEGSSMSVVNAVCRIGRGFCDGPIPRPEEFYLMCVTECDQV